MKKLLIVLISILVVSCKPGGNRSAKKGNDKPVITVTIEPLRYFTEAIAGDEFNVVSMVPKGSSPETYDPTPQQLVELAESKAYFRIGYIGFEQVWTDKLADNAPHLQFFDMSQGVDLIFDAPHNHPHHKDGNGMPQGMPLPPEGMPTPPDGQHPDSLPTPPHGEHHEGMPQPPTDGNVPQGPPPMMGVEPHIWNSATNAQTIATNILNALCALDKSHENDFIERYKTLYRKLERTDSLICVMLSAPEADRSFMIYHPALSYFARDYGLHQISIESGGKEPSPAHLKELINACKEEKVRVVFVQPEFDQRNAELIAQQTGTSIVSINPLSYDWETEMINVARALTGKIEEK
ncbi:MAG: zinc ABC transporter substrate-binding protein [Bacteroides sp.]|nr:zinc ABC transporter substrate-binding protein [Bacteroides sp.]